MRGIALALAIALVAPGSSASADAPAAEVARSPNIPERPEGQVLDQADILSTPVETALAKRLSAYWQQTRTAVVVVSVTSLNGEPVDQYSLELARKWEIGDKANLRGLLVLVSPSDHQARIEVSCGLENVITNAFAGQVMRDQLMPAFKGGRFEDGILAGIDALIRRLDASPNPAPVSRECQQEMRPAA